MNFSLYREKLMLHASVDCDVTVMWSVGIVGDTCFTNPTLHINK